MEKPLINIWEQYSQSLEDSIESGFIDEGETSQIYIWPRDLEMTDVEKEDIQRYTHERVVEIVQHHAKHRKHTSLDTTFLAAYIFRSILSGLMLEKQRQANLQKS